ncbi:hypothetical protein VTJ83DRAFT_382 [Remersonia thermophila]|uniref:Nitrogen permease regulator 2 n=1 Tax=Remersonia thermophila TaxID=72144 RepID=A0ABR4DM54_9PEZI
MIQGIFYARFFTGQEGTRIVAQSPPGCIVPEPGCSKEPLVDFKRLQNYIIPSQVFRNRYITVTDPDGKYCVLCFPVEIKNEERYFRNEFIFNFGLVVETDADQVPYEQVVRRLAATFAEMEKQSGYLSSQDSYLRNLLKTVDENEQGGGDDTTAAAPPASPAPPPPNIKPVANTTTTTITTTAAAAAATSGTGTGTGSNGNDSHLTRRPIASLLEIIREDLNNYGECMIPVDDANAINMKLFPHHPTPPPEVKGWHVPVAKMKFADVVDPTWDLTLQRVIAHIDGVSDVRRIAARADVSLELCQLALRHLLYYDTILLLDMFFFGACYAPRPGIHDFVANVGGMVDECANYVCIGPGPGRRRRRGGGGGGGGGEYGPGGGERGRGSGKSESESDSNSNSNSDSDEDDDDDDDDDDDNDDNSTDGSSTLRHHGRRSGEHGHRDAGAEDEHGPHQHHQHHHHRHPRVSNYTLIKLMTTFCYGKSVAEWLRGHMESGLDVLRLIDVRRFVQFGVIKGCLYRVHKHVVSKQYLAALATGQARPLKEGGDPLQKYTDGIASFDQIITEQDLTDGEIMERLKSFKAPAGDLTVLYR